MEKRKPSENHQRLERLVGDWKGEETLHETQVTPGGKAKGEFKFHRDLDGFFVVGDYVEKMGQKTLMKGHGVIGFDPKKGYTLHWFDSFGSPPNTPGIGKWEDDSLVFQHGEHGRTVFEFEPDGFNFKIEMNFGEKGFEPVVEGTYHLA